MELITTSWPRHAASAPTTSRGRTRHRIAVLVLPDTVPLGVLMLQSVFNSPVGAIADAMGVVGQSPYEIVLCSSESRQILFRTVDLGEMAGLDELVEADTVVVPGVIDPLQPRPEDILQALRDAEAAGARIVSTCSGAFILGHAGLLDGRRATTHWLLAPEFERAFPRARLDVDRLYVDDGPVHTSAGRLAGTDLAMHLLALDCGQAAANDVGRYLVSAPHRSGGQSQFVDDALRAAPQHSMQPVMTWLREHLTEPLTMASIAAGTHMSERTLGRRFRAATGMTVFDWIIRERINRAKVLLETTDFPIGEVAAMAGFGSTEGLRRHFEKAVGTTASGYRRTFRTVLSA
jgi:AraC family transcriptional regulator, transcriptional activator FtrA